jgi:hypothetical protein
MTWLDWYNSSYYDDYWLEWEDAGDLEISSDGYVCFYNTGKKLTLNGELVRSTDYI